MQIESAACEDEIRAIFNEENSILLFDTGFRKPTSTLTISDKNTICASLKLFYTITRSLPELEQFLQGLGDTMVAMLVTSPEVWKPFFVPAAVSTSLSKSM